MNVGHVSENSMGGKRSVANHGRSASPVGSRLGKGAGCARYWSALFISMIFVLGAFAIIPAQAAGPATVNLGTAGDFVVLAKTGISTTGTTHITGDIGVSPVAATYITGFGLTKVGAYSTSSLITGKVYAADYAPPTPAKMTTAVGDMGTAYTDAAGRTLPDYTELYAGDLTGKTLTPGLYKWGTGVLVSAGGVTISGAASDVWIFQIAQTLKLANNAKVTLISGAQASHIFWQVAGQVTLGTTAAMKGIILCKTLIAMNTGATLEGRALSQTAVTLNANTVTISVIADTAAPTVSSTVPTNAATGVSVNSAMAATFNEAMNPITINSTTFTLTQGVTPVSGTVTYTGVTATFTPAANLASSTVYTATITTGAKDMAGNAIASNYAWSFTTGAVSDTTPPTVSSTVPANAAIGVAIDSEMDATFSEAINHITITTATFTLKQGATSVSGAVTYAGVTATFTPIADLAPSTAYTATITTGAKDLAGNALASNYVWSFTTAGTASDITAPTVSSTIPANAATGVAVNSAMTATFSEAINPITITTATFTLKHGVTAVSGAVAYTGTTATFTPAANLASSTVYTATVTTGAKDLAGNALASNHVWSFTTGTASSSAGTISGRLVDNDGNPVANATVSLGNTGMNTITDANGDYSFSGVEPGTYSVGFNATGYEPSAVTSSVESGQTTTVPDTVMSPDDSGVSNLLWIIGAIAVALVAVLIGWKLMANRKKDKHA